MSAIAEFELERSAAIGGRHEVAVAWPHLAIGQFPPTRGHIPHGHPDLVRCGLIAEFVAGGSPTSVILGSFGYNDALRLV